MEKSLFCSQGFRAALLRGKFLSVNFSSFDCLRWQAPSKESHGKISLVDCTVIKSAEKESGKKFSFDIIEKNGFRTVLAATDVGLMDDWINRLKFRRTGLERTLEREQSLSVPTFSTQASVMRNNLPGSNQCDIVVSQGRVVWKKADGQRKTIRTAWVAVEPPYDIRVNNCSVTFQYKVSAEDKEFVGKSVAFESEQLAAEFVAQVRLDRTKHFLKSTYFDVGNHEERLVNGFIRQRILDGSPSLEYFYYNADKYQVLVDKLVARFNETLPEPSQKCTIFAGLLSTLMTEPVLIFVFLAFDLFADAIAVRNNAAEAVEIIAEMMSAKLESEYRRRRIRFLRLFDYHGDEELHSILNWLSNESVTSVGTGSFNTIPISLTQFCSLWDNADEKPLCFMIMQHNADHNMEFDLIRCGFDSIVSESATTAAYLAQKFALTNGDAEYHHFSALLMHVSYSSPAKVKYLCQQFAKTTGYDNEFFHFFLKNSVGEGDHVPVAYHLLQTLLFKDGAPDTGALSSCHLIAKLVFAHVHSHIERHGQEQESLNDGLKLLVEIALQLEDSAIANTNLLVLSKQDQLAVDRIKFLGEQHEHVQLCLQVSDIDVFNSKFADIVAKLNFMEHMSMICKAFIAEGGGQADWRILEWLRSRQTTEALLYGFITLLLDLDCYSEHHFVEELICGMDAAFFQTFFAAPGELRTKMVKRFVFKLNIANIYNGILRTDDAIFMQASHFQRSFLESMSATIKINNISHLAETIVLVAVKLDDLQNLKNVIVAINKMSNNQLYLKNVAQLLPLVLHSNACYRFLLDDIDAVARKLMVCKLTNWKLLEQDLSRTPCCHWMDILSGVYATVQAADRAHPSAPVVEATIVEDAEEQEDGEAPVTAQAFVVKG